ncbi:GPI-anchored surface protein, putative [Bodo saltans]|uniref:GPI-anchored surface protein, putative n=1 Tax=Bodo saltans TaxID=75058 RepID=A0A0S4JMM0_BODSA|nr:GPI-anchored surface protein, putative [Bodo saltans]|eukprot:CUG90354.1 GPI-anchored surface protein, putative [Bodo saltans]
MSSELRSSASLSTSAAFVFTTRIPFPNAQAASTAAQVLRVDGPITNTLRSIEEENHVLVIRMQSQALRSLRTAVHSTLEQLTLILRTMEAFAPSA